MRLSASAGRSQSLRPAPLVQLQELFGWLHCFSNPYCLLAKSPCDLRSGIVFCELLAVYKQSPVAGVVYDAPQNEEMCLHNIGLAIREISRYIPRLEEVVSVEDIYADSRAACELLKVIKELFDSEARHSENPEQPRSPSFGVNNDEFEQPGHEPSSFHVNVSKKPVPKTRHSTAVSPKRNNSKAKKSVALSSCQSSRIPSTCQSSTRHSPAGKIRHGKTSSQQQDWERGGPAETAQGKVAIGTKHRLVEWLQDISLIRRNAVSIAEFPGYCRNGVLLYDLIARLEGKQTSLRNVDRNPRKQATVFANVKKCLEHLREFEKMNPRHLWSVQEIVEGNAEVIWGLLEDIWSLHHNKSLRIASKAQPQASSRRTASPFKKGILPEYSLQVKTPSKQPQETARKSPIESKKHGATPTSTRHSASKQRNFNSFCRRANKSFDAGSFVQPPKPSANHSLCESQRSFKFPNVTEEQERLTRVWLRSLNLALLSMNEAREMLKDPYRNGVLLCDLAETLEHVKLLGRFNSPKAVFQAERNIRRALHTLSKYVPSCYLENSECVQGVLKGNREAVWGLLNGIRESYVQATQQEHFQAADMKLPCSAENVKKLEVSIMRWLRRLGVVKQSSISSIFEILRELRNGTLLCELAEIMCKRKLNGVFRNPKTDATSLTNLRKALDCLRTLPKVSLK